MRSIVARAVPAALFLAAVCAVPVLAQQTAPAAPTADERAVAAFIEAHNADGLALLEKVVNINSGTQNLAGVREVGAVFRAELTRLGFKTHLGRRRAVERAGHLVADASGPRPKILLIGHLDTVFERGQPVPEIRAPRREDGAAGPASST